MTYRWVVYLHVLGGLGFMLAHGVSVTVAFKLRHERDQARIRALLVLSTSSYNVMYIALLMLLGAGITAGFMGNWWGRGWIWTAIGLLLALVVGMGVYGTLYYHRVRKAVGLPYFDNWRERPPVEPVGAEELDALLNSQRPVWLTVMGLGGLALIVWLMMFKPF